MNTFTEHSSSDLSVPDGATPHKENKEKSPQILQ